MQDTRSGARPARGAVTPGHWTRTHVGGLYSGYQVRIVGDPYSRTKIVNGDPHWAEGVYSC
ncbi:hypothetical protein [Sphaerisporangium corydalis]|uniref:Uncharacterized protein n=1 Tax=Sphaerisporangium corydalis TaxID=1441875 RepID=A0ABV9EPI8_9ACTN|nr:hypothetical protein [Sphaerisporangium corydalis]